MARTTAQRKGHDFLGIYLNDHLADAAGGVGLARDCRLDVDRLDDLLNHAKRQSDMLATVRVAVAERVLATPTGGPL
jgi:hypothetical protein